jgi:hypothetical protein
MAVQKPRKPTASRTPTHYQVLMVDPCVDDEVLTAVYRRMMQRGRLADLEDDRRTQVLRVLEEAYAVLHDPERRRRYDQLLAGMSDGTGRPAAAAERHGVPVSSGAPKALPVSSGAPKALPVSSGASKAIPVAAARTTVPAAAARATVPVAPPSPTTAVSTRVLDFGRYAGWSLRQVALRDPNYLEWLRRTPGGRQYQTEIAAILTPR